VVFVHLWGITDRLKSHQNVTELLEITRSRVQRRLARMSSVESYPTFRQTLQLPSSGRICIDLVFLEPYLEQAYVALREHVKYSRKT
jgi:hypothetical protein